MVKNITVSAEESLIRKAREKAKREKKSLNSIFREWLAKYVGQDQAGKNYETLMEKLRYARSGKKFTRDELNER
ncbi:hypothetical protein ACFLU6_01430 [Acidobacteriota bacterium]